MKNILIFSFIIFLFSMTSCKSNKTTQNQNSEVKVFWVNSSKMPCQGVGPMTCLQVQEGEEIEEGKWLNFFSTIEGFDYKPGNIYRIKVNVEQLPPPIPADASSLKYRLVEIISEEPDRTLRITDIFNVIRVGDIENPVGMEKSVTIEFNAAERRVFGFSGCNTFRGSIAKLSENEIEFGNLASTMMACPQPNMELERSVTQALQKVKKYTFQNRNLIFKDIDGKELLGLLKVD
jgi:heat shock protein HslJ